MDKRPETKEQLAVRLAGLYDGAPVAFNVLQRDRRSLEDMAGAIRRQLPGAAVHTRLRFEKDEDGNEALTGGLITIAPVPEAEARDVPDRE